MSLIASATATGAMLTMCSSKDRQASRRKAASNKSSKSKRAGSKSSTASGASTKSHRSSSKSGKSSRSQRHKKHGGSGKKKASSSTKKSKKDVKKGSSEAASGAAPVTVAAIPAGTSKRQSETKKSSRSDRSTSRKSKRSSSKKCKAQQCEPNKLKKAAKRNAICPSNSSDASSKSGRSEKSGRRQKKSASGSGSLSGEKALKAVPNNSNYKFPEGQIKPSAFRASPAKLPFAPTGGVMTVTIPNSTKSRKAFKVKTSDNVLYRVNPVHGFVEPGAAMSIDVLRQSGGEKTDHLVVLTSDAVGDAQCAKAIFETDPPRELTVVPLVAH